MTRGKSIGRQVRALGRGTCQSSAGPRSGVAGRRRGAFTVVVLVALLVAMMVFGALVRKVMLHSRQAGHEVQRVQTAWLAESGIERAASRLARNADYVGETWKIDPLHLRKGEWGTVIIRIETITEQPQRRRVVVEAQYPVDGPEQIRITRQATITLAGKS
jgi:Tfp pilus assembly protein PilX